MLVVIILIIIITVLGYLYTELIRTQNRFLQHEKYTIGRLRLIESQLNMLKINTMGGEPLYGREEEAKKDNKSTGEVYTLYSKR